MHHLDQVRRDALDLVNTARRALDYDQLDDLLPGTPDNGYGCSLAASLDVDCLAELPSDLHGTDHRVFLSDALDVADQDHAANIARAWRTWSEETCPGVYSVRLPGRLCEFIQAFDAGYYPDLVLTRQAVAS